MNGKINTRYRYARDQSPIVFNTYFGSSLISHLSIHLPFPSMVIEFSNCFCCFSTTWARSLFPSLTFRDHTSESTREHNEKRSHRHHDDTNHPQQPTNSPISNPTSQRIQSLWFSFIQRFHHQVHRSNFYNNNHPKNESMGRIHRRFFHRIIHSTQGLEMGKSRSRIHQSTNRRLSI